jgi:hypothetical protein
LSDRSSYDECVISIERIRELVQLGNENRNLDYKGAFSWEDASNDEKCEIAKDVLAFSNTRDGGVIVIGVHDKSGALEGLTQDQYRSFDQTKFNSFIQKYTDPRHTARVHRIVVDEKRIVVIDIPEFSDVPVLCARDANRSSDPSKLILKKAALYKRTERATSEVIEDAEEMRELLNRGLMRRQDDLLRAFKQIIQPNDLNRALEPGAEFRAEIESAELYFSELGDGSFVKLPHWIVQMQPESYIVNRISTATELQRRVQQSAISLRGWTFPIVGRVAASQWTNFESGSQSFHSGRGDRPEAIRVYKSGLIMWRAGIGEDYWQGLADQNVLSFIGIIYSVTEWLLFARRFYEAFLSVDESVLLTVRASGVKGRKLVALDPRVELGWEYRTEVPAFEIKATVAVSELRADPESLARKIIRGIFELFNWNDPEENMLQNWQQKLIQRQF